MEKLKQNIIINQEFSHLKNELLKIDTFFNSSEITIHNARNKLKIIEIDSVKLVVKSFKVPNLFNKIVYTSLKSSKAKKSYLNGVRLIELGIQTPTPVAYIETYKLGFLDKSYCITICEEYDFTIREVFHHKVEDVEIILKQFAQFTYNLHQKGIWHVDYSLGNILITKKEDYYKFSLVDINRMKFNTILPAEGLKNFNKFWAKDENDLVIIAKEYARLSGFDEEKAIQILIEEQKKVIDFKNKKKQIKQLLGK